MCKCVNVEFGSYSNEVVRPIPIHMKSYSIARLKAGLSNTVGIDSCLVDEIEYLWKLGIRTTGCCCGHNKELPFIGVFEEDEYKMLQLGYKVHPNETDSIRTDSFYARSI